MLNLARGWRAGALAAALAFALPAQAAPILYQYTSGQATVTASSSTAPLPGGLGHATLTLNGVFADFDPITGQLTDFQFTTAPNQWINLNTVYGGFNQVWVNSASVVPGTGYNTDPTLPAPVEISPGHWLVSVKPVDVHGIYTGKNSITSVSAGPFPVNYTNVTPLNATIDVLAGTFTLQGITLGVIPVPGEADVTVGAVLTFQGATPVPEPAALGLLALGSLALAFARSRARCA
ncbi:MAG: PEP-CTERM sorting domain-containing protein [Myxococcota bacterium]